LVGEVAQYTKEVLQQVADEYGFWVDTMEVMEDRVHVFIEVPPNYSAAGVVQILKSISARQVFKKFRKLREQFWSGELWSDGYFVRSVGGKVTADVIRRHIEYQTREHTSPQLPMFE
jgi:putative transposase